MNIKKYWINIELNTKNIINLNADDRVHLNTNAVFLGKYDENNNSLNYYNTLIEYFKDILPENYDEL